MDCEGNRRKKKKVTHFCGIELNVALLELERAAEKLNIIVRYEKGDFNSCSCKINKQKHIIIKKTDSYHAKIESLINELSKLKFETIDLHPTLLKCLSDIKMGHREFLLKEI